MYEHVLYLRLTCYPLAEGIPYDVTIVAFTSAGGGPQSDRVTFFSQELPPSRTVDLSTVNTMLLSETSINVTWEGLTLFEAQGFPVYIVTIVLMTDNNRKRRQSTPDRTIITVTGSTYVVFNRLVPGGRYSGEIGVRSRGAAMQGFMMSVGSINIIGTYVLLYQDKHIIIHSDATTFNGLYQNLYYLLTHHFVFL